MRIEVNGEKVDVAVGTLADVLIELGYTDAAVATAVNGDFVPVAARTAQLLEAGDRVEVLAPMQGG